jgi:hypothetical protein
MPCHVGPRWSLKTCGPSRLAMLFFFHNSSICHSKQKSPYELVTGQLSPWYINDFRVFGCPLYVLQKKLQDGDSYSKWKACSWQGMYVGQSSCHESSIPLIFYPSTTHVSPQFHMVYDEGFQSLVTHDSTALEKFYMDLYNLASWLHSSPYADAMEEYHYDSFWRNHPWTHLQRSTHENVNVCISEGATSLTLPLLPSQSPIQTSAQQKTPLVHCLLILLAICFFPPSQMDNLNVPLSQHLI